MKVAHRRKRQKQNGQIIALSADRLPTTPCYCYVLINLVVILLQCVRKKRDQNVLCNIFYKTQAILIKSVKQFSE